MLQLHKELLELGFFFIPREKEIGNELDKLRDVLRKLVYSNEER